MTSILSNLPARPLRRENISVLTVSPSGEDHRSLCQIFRHQDWRITNAVSCADAAKSLDQISPSVILCDRQLPDGSWKQLFRALQSTENAPMMVVVAPTADNSLWAEVLNLGGYDVLLKPFDKQEVIRVVTMAWRHWKSSNIRVPVLCQ